MTKTREQLIESIKELSGNSLNCFSVPFALSIAKLDKMSEDENLTPEQKEIINNVVTEFGNNIQFLNGGE